MMLEILLPVAYILLLLMAMICAALAVLHAFKMYLEIEPSKQNVANLLPFLVGVLPGFLTPAGEKARKAFVSYLVAGVVCAALAAVILGVSVSV